VVGCLLFKQEAPSSSPNLSQEERGTAWCGEITNSCNPSYFVRQRSGGLRFKASLGKKVTDPMSVNKLGMVACTCDQGKQEAVGRYPGLRPWTKCETLPEK
jgi:hypothetical protein